jgi:pimeloyl-ACP methyl ester carboxylesterase
LPTIQSNGVWLHFEQDGEPNWPTVLLVHGFASSGDDNWLQSGWVKRMHEAKRRTLRVDCRGHGKSEKPRDPKQYSLDLFAADLEEVLRYANARTVDLCGYSMGSRISLQLLLRKPARLRSVILGGVGGNVVRGLPENDGIVAALEAPDAAKVTNPVGRAFRQFAESRGNDLRALAAVRRGGIGPLDAKALANVKTPVLVWAGANDALVGAPSDLAALIPGARSVVVPDSDHLSAVSHPASCAAVLGFLQELDARH